MSDVLLVQVKTGMDIGSSVAAPHGLLCVAAPLDRAGYKVKIIDQRTNPYWRTELLDDLDTKPIFVGITAMTGTQITFAIEVAKIVRGVSRVPIVWGGAHSTLLPQQILDSGYGDYVCQREVDETIVDITRKIANKTQVERIIDSPLPDMEKLLPTPWHLIDVEKYIHKDIYVKDSPRTLDVGQTSRRCPYNCVVAGTSINTIDNSCRNVERIYNKELDILGFDNDKVVANKIAYGEESMTEEVIEITIEDGRTLLVTPNHFIYTKRGWIEAGLLNENDEVLSIRTPDMKRVFKKCDVCGQYKYMRLTSKYCSKECYDKAQNKNRPPRICPVCGESFEIKNTRMRNQVYCSISCHTKYQNSIRDTNAFKTTMGKPEVREKLRLSKLGDKNPMKRADVVQKMIQTSKDNGRYEESSARFKQLRKDGKIPHGEMSLESRAKIAERMTMNNPMFNKELAIKVGKLHSYRYKNDVGYRDNILQSRNRHPNNMELLLTNVIQKNNLPFRFTGNFTYWVGKCESGVCRNPDYVDNGHKKKVILAHGNYHHKNEHKNQVEINDYKQQGYDVLVIWEEEIMNVENENNLVEKIRGYYGS